MTNVIPFPQRITSEPIDHWKSHALHVGEKVEALKSIARGLGKTDGLTLACNLGELIEARARDHGLTPYAALEIVWEKFDPERSRWSKRLRYVRFSDERDNRNPEVAGSGADFLGLAAAIAVTLPVRSLPPEHNLTDIHARLLRRTDFDPEPAIAASVDFDAARGLVELMDRAVAKIVEAAPELPEYFRRIEMHGLTHPESGEPFNYDSANRPMQPFDHFKWVFEKFEAPEARDLKWSMTVSPATMREGFWFEDGAGLDALLPRVVLGRITYAVRVGSICETTLARVSGLEVPMDADLIIRMLSEHDEFLQVLLAEPEDLNEGTCDIRLLTFEIQLVLVPSADPQSPGVRAGLIVRPPHETFDGQTHSPLEGRDAYDGIFQLIDTNGNRRFALDRPSLKMAGRTLPLPPGMTFDSLFLFPGNAADHVLGLRHTAPIHEVGLHQLPFAISIEPNFETPAGFAPQAATSLGGLLTRNLLYAARLANVVDHLIEDARARAARLDAQYQQWMTGFVAARDAFFGGNEKPNS